jgi:hypothetical protein
MPRSQRPKARSLSVGSISIAGVTAGSEQFDDGYRVDFAVGACRFEAGWLSKTVRASLLAEEGSAATRGYGRSPGGESGPLTPRPLVEEISHVAGSLVWREERDDDLPRAAALASQAVLDLNQWKGVAEMLTQLLERQSSSVFALAAIRAVKVRIVDVREGCGLELSVFHVQTLAPAGCDCCCITHTVRTPSAHCMSRVVGMAEVYFRRSRKIERLGVETLERRGR